MAMGRVEKEKGPGAGEESEARTSHKGRNYSRHKCEPWADPDLGAWPPAHLRTQAPYYVASRRKAQLVPRTTQPGHHQPLTT